MKKPTEKEFIEMLVNLITKGNGYTITENELTNQIIVALQDEFIATIEQQGNNSILLSFDNSERFLLKIEKI